jgi:hypothetical protein
VRERRKEAVGVGDEPVAGAGGFGAEALEGEPEAGGVVGDGEVDGFVGDDIAEDEVGGQDEAPVEGEIPQGGAVAPFGALAHDVDFAGGAPDAWQNGLELGLNGCPGFLSEPVFEAADRRGAGAGGLGDENIAVFAGDFVLAPLRDGASDANEGGVAAKEDAELAVARGFDDGVECFGAVKFAEKPVLVSMEERRDVVAWPGGRANDLDTMRTDADAKFLGGPRRLNLVLDLAV